MAGVRLEKAVKDYGATRVIHDVDLQIDDGEFAVFVGPSGCGKSTLLRILLGQEAPDRGEVRLEGTPLVPFPSPHRGIVFQKYSAMPHLTCLGNVMLGLELRESPVLGRLFGAARRRARDEAMAWLRAVGLDHAAKSFPAALSGGMQQRLALAQSMALKPKILLMDEPFGALDPGIRADMHQLLFSLWEESGMTVLMVSHDLPEAFSLGTRVLVLDKPDPARPAQITYDLALKPRPVQTHLEKAQALAPDAPQTLS